METETNIPSIDRVIHKKKKRESSACVYLSGKKCKFPCRKVNTKTQKGKCRTRFSKKRIYKDMGRKKSKKKKKRKISQKKTSQNRKSQKKRLTLISEELQPEDTPEKIEFDNEEKPEPTPVRVLFSLLLLNVFLAPFFQLNPTGNMLHILLKKRNFYLIVLLILKKNFIS